jgi:hypothetical protein
MEPTLASIVFCIRDGKLYRIENGVEREHQSEFIEEKIADRQRAQEAQGWIRRPRASEGMGPWSQQNLIWGQRAARTGELRYRFTQVVRLNDDVVLYSVTFNDVTGLFKYSISENYEQRIFHRNDLALYGLGSSPDGNTLAAAIQTGEQGIHLVQLDAKGHVEKQLTAGDSHDLTPAFTPDGAGILYSTAGFVTAEDGTLYDLAPHAILRLDLASGSITKVCSDPAFDLLQPRQLPDGSILAIRRPYRSRRQPGLWTELRGILLFPFFFLGAVWNFLNAFVRLFNRQATVTAGAEVREPPRKFVTVLGETIDVAKVKQRGEEAALVPGTWELIRIRPGQAAEVLRRHICGFDVVQDRIVATDGFRIFPVGGEGILHRSTLIEGFCVVRSGTAPSA